MLYARTLITAAALVAVLSAAHAQSAATPSRPRGESMQDMMGGGQMMGGAANGRESTKAGGIVGIALALESDSVGAPGRLVVRAVEPQSPAHYAGVMRGDRIVAVDGQSVDGKKLDDVADMVRGEVGSTVKLSLARDDKSRDVSLTRVEPQRRMRRGMGRMGNRGGMMDMMRMHQGMMGSAPGGAAAEPQR
jgi:C-terminal processing protease CtpA/Prc